MQRLFSFFFFVLIGATTFAQSDNIIGTWLTGDKGAHVKIYKSNNQFMGKIIWLKDPNNPKTGKPWLDEQNEDPSKRLQPLIGSLILWGFTFDDGEYTQGKVYDSRNGETYTGKLWLTDNNTLKMRGYVGFFYSTETWIRIKE